MIPDAFLLGVSPPPALPPPPHAVSAKHIAVANKGIDSLVIALLAD
jgi:hypothetical protein